MITSFSRLREIINSNGGWENSVSKLEVGE